VITGARVFRSLFAFRVKRINLMSVQNSIVIGEIFQIEVSDGLVHQLGSCQNINLYPARLQGHEFFLGVCMRLEILMITAINEQNSIFISEAFQIEVSDGPVHQRGSCQNVNLHPAKVFTLGEFLGV